MAYEILPRTVKEFISDTTIRYPRFQRKSTWKPKQNFNLCISMFKNYPLGVVILNGDRTENGQVNYLLDGRQRRQALKSQIEDPLKMYENAQKTLGFRPGNSTEEVRQKFWDTVGEFLKEEGSPEDDNGGNESNSESFGDRSDERLKLLLNLILMVHRTGKAKECPWLKRWNLQKFFKYLPYMDNRKVDPIRLRSFIVEKLSERLPEKSLDISPEKLVEAFKQTLSSSVFEKNGEVELTSYVGQSIDALREDIRILRASTSMIYSEAKLGVIVIKDVSNLDRQKIFSLVNTGGTALKAEELLSAKPFWNKEVQTSLLDVDIQNKIVMLYQRLGIPGEDNAYVDKRVYWDFCATLIDRIDKQNIVFPKIKGSDDQNDLMNRIVWGFKLAASCMEGGFSASFMDKIETDKIDIPQEVNEIVRDLNNIFSVLLKDKFYQRLKKWEAPFVTQLGFSASFEFLALLRKRWIHLDCGNGANTKQFLHESFVVFDRLVYEYASGLWSGSSDTTMSKHLTDPESRITALPFSDWQALVDRESGVGCSSYKRKEPLLLYLALLSNLEPDPSQEYSYDVDHIIPQAAFKALPKGSSINPALQDAIGNLAIFPKSKNCAKKDRTLNELGVSLASEVEKYAMISKDKFDEYSSITNLQVLLDERKAIILQILKKRDELFAN